MVNKAELMVEYNKDLSIEEANAKLEENKETQAPIEQSEDEDRSQV